MTATTSRLTSEEFLAGLLATLALRNWDRISIRGDRFDRASVAAYQELTRVSDEFDVSPRFHLVQHPTYGDSSVMREAIARLAQWDLIGLDNPEYQDLRLKMDPLYAKAVFNRLSLNQELFNRLADRFVEAYESPIGGVAAQPG